MTSAKWFGQTERKIPVDRGVKNTNDYLKAKDLLVLFYKGCGFCVMKKTTFREKLDDVLNLDQLLKIIEAKN